jgi:hypothetical protein
MIDDGLLSVNVMRETRIEELVEAERENSRISMRKTEGTYDDTTNARTAPVALFLQGISDTL